MSTPTQRPASNSESRKRAAEVSLTPDLADRLRALAEEAERKILAVSEPTNQGGGYAEVLTAHVWMRGLAQCRCGWEDPAPNWCGEEERHHAHLEAAILASDAHARLIAAEKAEAWDEAIEAVAWCLDNGESSTAAALAYVHKNNRHRATSDVTP